MSRIKSTGTSPEREITERLVALRLKFECHPKDIPGRPDVVFRGVRVAIFVDGDFWHGWRFPLWKGKLSEKWATKIQLNRARDCRNFSRLRRLKWKVVRIWEHQIEQNPAKCIARVLRAISDGRRLASAAS